MTNISDLHIDDEIIPLFDFTYNLFSGQAVREIITERLDSKPAILFRQQVLKGFIANREVLKDYSYSRFNLSDIYTFFETFSAGPFFGAHLRWKLMFSEKNRHEKRGKLIMLVLLFNKIRSAYLEKIDTKLFPEEYATELTWINNFFVDFNLEHYESIFRKKRKLKVAHIVELL